MKIQNQGLINQQNRENNHYSVTASLGEPGAEDQPKKTTSRLFDLSSGVSCGISDQSILQKRAFSNTEGIQDAKLCLTVTKESCGEANGEYHVEAPFNSEFMPKVQQWIAKRKFRCSQVSDEQVSVKIGNIFEFTAQKSPESDMQSVQKEIKALQADWLNVDRELKLFNFYFFNHWRGETSRDAVRSLGQPIVCSDDLFYIVSGMGHVEQPNSIAQLDFSSINSVGVPPPPQKENEMIENGLLSAIDDLSGGMFGNNNSIGGAGSNQGTNSGRQQVQQQSANLPQAKSQSSVAQYFIVFKEPLSGEIMQSQDAIALSKGQTSHQKRISVILYGQGCREHIQAKIGRGYAKKTVQVDSTSYYYPVNVSIKAQQVYQLYIPRAF